MQSPAASIPDPEIEPTIDVPRAGRLAFGLGRAGSYRAAERGDLPVIRLGNRLRVPTAELRRMLGLDPVSREKDRLLVGEATGRG